MSPLLLRVLSRLKETGVPKAQAVYRMLRRPCADAMQIFTVRLPLLDDSNRDVRIAAQWMVSDLTYALANTNVKADELDYRATLTEARRKLAERVKDVDAIIRRRAVDRVNDVGVLDALSKSDPVVNVRNAAYRRWSRLVK
jgi:hypothetical protein